MWSPHHSDDVIEALVHIAFDESASVRLKHAYRESLRNLVRLAKAERTLELEVDVKHQSAKSEMQTVH